MRMFKYLEISGAFVLLLIITPLVSAHGGSGMGMMGQMDDDDCQNRMMQQRGMMGGMGMMNGQGMMGGMGMMNGHGMMDGMGPMMMLDLNDKQRNTMQEIMRGTQKQNWKRMGEMMELRNQLQDIMQADKPDPAAAGKIYDKMAKLRQEMFQARLETRNKMMDQLTSEQREKLREYRGQYWQGRVPGMMME